MPKPNHAAQGDVDAAEDQMEVPDEDLPKRRASRSRSIVRRCETSTLKFFEGSGLRWRRKTLPGRGFDRASRLRGQVVTSDIMFEGPKDIAFA